MRTLLVALAALMRAGCVVVPLAPYGRGPRPVIVHAHPGPSHW